MLGDYDSAPDVVAYPGNEAEIAAVMDWAGSVGASLTPFGGGSSVCGGVEQRSGGERYRAAVTLDLRNLGKVLEVDADFPRGADRGRRLWPGTGEPAQAARPDAAAFSAELRIFDPGRLDRDAVRAAISPRSTPI